MTSMFSVSGLASGLDTQSMVQQLMQLERQPVVRLQAQQDNLRQVDDAWGKIATGLSSLRSAVDAVARPGELGSAFAVSSSNDTAVRATAIEGGSPQAGSVSVNVARLATVGQAASQTTFSSPDHAVGAGTFRFSVGSDELEVTTIADASLEDLADLINDAGSSARAQVLKVGSDSYRLVITSEKTGADQAVSVLESPPGLGAFDTTQVAGDAEVQFGGITVHRASNVVDDLVAGVRLELRQTGPAVIDVERDLDDAAARVEAMVGEFNKVLETADTLGSTSTASRGPLGGDSTLRALVTELRNVLASGIALPGGDRAAAADVGISLTRDGRVALDTAQLRTALETDLDGSLQLLVPGVTIDSPHVSRALAGSQTQPGAYDVVVTQAARRAEVETGAWAAPAVDQGFTITLADDDPVEVAVAAGATRDQALAAINNALEAAGVPRLRATATADGGIRLADAGMGSAGTFTVAGSAFGLEGTHAGVDVAGTIDGQAATGRGQSLVAAAGPAQGLSVTVTMSEAELAAAGGSLDLGPVEATSGLAGALSGVTERFAARDGMVERARERITGRISRTEDRIEAFDVRLELRRRALVRQFTGMETAMGQLIAQGNWMAGQLGGLGGQEA